MPTHASLVVSRSARSRLSLTPSMESVPYSEYEEVDAASVIVQVEMSGVHAVPAFVTDVSSMATSVVGCESFKTTF